MLNVVALMGRLTKDPELRSTPQGTSVCKFDIAVDRGYVRQNEPRRADFITVVTWRSTAEFVCNYFHKGSLIAIHGAIQTRAYQDTAGNTRKAFEVIANDVHFAEKTKENMVKQTENQCTEDEFLPIDSDEDLPF